MTLERALALCREKRPAVAPIPAFMDQLRRYEIQCREDGLIANDNHVEDDVSKNGEGGDTVGKKLDLKKRKVMKGCAIGPSLPPSSKRRVMNPSLPDKPNDKAGGSSEGGTVDNNGDNKRPAVLADDEESTRQVAKITPSSTRQASIGPSLPPGFQRG